jgi:hypothetical protein
MEMALEQTTIIFNLYRKSFTVLNCIEVINIRTDAT